MKKPIYVTGKDNGPEPMRAARVLIAEHFKQAPRDQCAGVLKRTVRGETDCAVYTVSGELIAYFDEMLSRMDPNWLMHDGAPVVDIKPAADVELMELRKIAGIPEGKKK